MKNEYEVNGEVTSLFINCRGNKERVLISTCDIERVKEFPNTWYGYYIKRRKSIIVAGNLPWEGKKRKRTLLTRWILNPPDDLVVDHINHDTMDNRRKNLRVITIAENNQNRKGPNSINETSKYLGVSYDRVKKSWVGYLTVNKRRIFLGYFDTELKAHKVVTKARARLMPYSKERRKWTYNTQA